MRSKVTRRISCSRDAGEAGFSPAASSFASTKASMGFRTQSRSFTAGGSRRTGGFQAQWFFCRAEKEYSSAAPANAVAARRPRRVQQRALGCRIGPRSFEGNGERGNQLLIYQGDPIGV